MVFTQFVQMFKRVRAFKQW